MTSTTELSQKVLSQLQELAQKQNCSSEEMLQQLLDTQTSSVDDTLYRAIYENASDAILVINNKQRYVAVNQAACDLLGYSEDEFLTLSTSDLIAEDDNRQTKVIQVWQEQGMMKTVYRLSKKDGSSIYVDVSAAADVIKNHHVAIMRDATDNVQAIDSMVNSQIALESIFSSTQTPFFNVHIVSSDTLTLDGLSDDVLSLSIDKIHQPLTGEPYPQDTELTTYQEIVLYFAAKCFEIGRMVQFESLCQADEQTYLWLTRLTPVRATNGKIERVLGFYDDLTHHMNTETSQETFELYEKLSQAQELNRYKAESTAMIAHEFQTPLSVISTASYMLSRLFDDMQEITAVRTASQRLERIDTQVERLKGLMSRVISLNYGTLMQQDLQLSQIHCCDFVSDLTDELKDVFTELNPITLHCDVSTPTITTDTELMRGIITNLVSNAIKYSSESTAPIIITCREDTHVFEFIVKDHGIGIPDDDLEKLFNFFQRGSNTAQHQGIGIGLMVIKQNTMRLGGTVDIESQVGQGTTVTIRLPKRALQTDSVKSSE